MRDQLEAKALARAKVRARRKRAAIIRRRTAWFTTGIFLVAWVVIFAQLVGGHDPALARSKVRRQVAVERRTRTAPVREQRRQAPPHHRRHRRHRRHHASASTTTVRATTPAPATTTQAPPPTTTAAPPPPPPTPVVTQQS
jgi:hypothetical protein